MEKKNWSYSLCFPLYCNLYFLWHKCQLSYVLLQGRSKKKSVLLVISLAGIKVCSPEGKVSKYFIRFYWLLAHISYCEGFLPHGQVYANPFARKKMSYIFLRIKYVCYRRIFQYFYVIMLRERNFCITVWIYLLKCNIL